LQTFGSGNRNSLPLVKIRRMLRANTVAHLSHRRNCRKY